MHGDLSKEEQFRAFQKFSKPKVILATNIAETSLTFDGVTSQPKLQLTECRGGDVPRLGRHLQSRPGLPNFHGQPWIVDVGTL